MALYSSLSLQKSPVFSSILSKTSNEFRCNHLRIQPLKIYSSSAVVNFSGSSIKQPTLLQRNTLGFSIGAQNGNGGGGGETEKKEVLVVDDELAGVPIAVKVIGIVAACVSMNVALVTISHHIGALVSAIYNDLVASPPVPDLTVITILTSIVVAIAEVTVHGSAVSQPDVLTLTGIVGYAAIKSIIPQPLCWILLVFFFCYSRFVKRKDYVSSAFPSAAVLTVVGEPWLRLLVIGSFTALAICQRTKKRLEGEIDVSNSVLLPAALVIGFCNAAKCFQFFT